MAFRKIKNNKYESLAIAEASLDFHNRGSLSPTQITSLCEDFIKDARHNKYSKVLIITGKGLHSAEKAIVKPLVLQFLENSHIKKFHEARRDRGGEGAFEIWL